MKALRVIAFIAVAVLLAGCGLVPTKPAAKSTAGHAAPSPSFVTAVLDRLLPSDFRGRADLEERGQYLTIIITAGDVHRTSAGEWTWAWLEYHRTLNIPLFFGVPWKHEGIVRLGTPGTTTAPK
jgi:hypothetical protein